MSAARKPTSRKKHTTKAASRKGARKTASSRSADNKAAPKKTSAGPASGTGSSADKTVKKKAVKSTAKPKKAARKATRTARPDRKAATGSKKTTASKRSARRSDRLDAKTMAKLRGRLEEERRGLSAEMAELEEESFQTTQSDITGEAGVDEDFADAGTATFDREQALSIANNIRDLIGQVDRALIRMDEGTYGACERCGRPIDPVRLRALPRTLLCAECKRREERAR